MDGREGITPGSSVFDTFEDGIDFAISTDKTIEDALEQLKQDEIDDILDNQGQLREAYQQVMEDNDEISIVVERDFDEDLVPSFSMSPVDIAAEDYIQAYQDLSRGIGMDEGEMIDMVSGQI